MTTSTVSIDSFYEVSTAYSAAITDLQDAVEKAGENRRCAAEDRVALKEIESRWEMNPPELPEGVRDNAETRKAALSLALRGDADYQSITESMRQHETDAAAAETAAEVARFKLRLWLRVLDHHNALLGVERGA